MQNADDQGYVPPEEPPSDDQLFSSQYLDSLEPQAPQGPPAGAAPQQAKPGPTPELSFAAQARDWIEVSIRAALAAVMDTGLPVATASAVLGHANETLSHALSALGSNGRVLRSAIHHALVQMGDQESGSVWIGSLSLSSDPSVSKEVRELFKELQACDERAEDPAAEFSAAAALARKLRSAQAAWDLSDSIKDAADPDELTEKHSEVVSHPPVAVRTAGTTMDNKSADDILAEADLDTSGYKLPIASGFWSLDYALNTRPEFPIGFTRSGQLTTISARTGSGKTSCLNTLLPAAVADVVSQGHEGRVLYIQVEDDLNDVLKNMGFSPGRRYSHLAPHLAPLKTSSLQEMTRHFYREVLRATRLSERTGSPLQAYMPPALYLDHASAIQCGPGVDDVEASGRAADMLLFGLCNCDPEACYDTSGVRYEDFAGESWPRDELKDYNLSVVTTIQTLMKGAGATTPYDPAKHDWRQYVIADDHDDPSWEVLPGDMPLSDPQSVKGKTNILDNSQLIMFLHRPKVQGNVVAQGATTPCGNPTLEDTRGYFQIIKARYGQRAGMRIIPMEFNLQRNGGSKAQYFDQFAEKQIELGVLTPEIYNNEIWTAAGDPLIPKRPVRSKASLVTY